MATKREKSKTSGIATNGSVEPSDLALEDGGLEGPSASFGGETTGNMIVTPLSEEKDALDLAIGRLSNMTGLSSSPSNVLSTADFDDAEGVGHEQWENVNFVRLERIGVAIVSGESDAMQAASAATVEDDGVVVEPEFWNYALGVESTVEILEGGDADLGIVDDLGIRDSGGAGVSRDFLLGARSMIDMLLEQQGGAAADVMSGVAGHCFRDAPQFTWGVQATGVHNSTLSGSGVKVAVLDTGFDIGHPDFAGRSVTRQSFIPASQPDNTPGDRAGHGTHCIGTSCGSRNPGIGARYGIAFEATIFSGKVLRVGVNGRAAGADGWILAGIDWAMQNRCNIISMSLGSRATSSRFPQSYERAARTGLRDGILILAASGNDSRRRRGQMDPVGRPANCPSIAAVAAVDNCLRVADFSNGQRFGNGGEVNLSGPGVNVLSSVPMPRRRAVFNGTSMATPHVAGIAALVQQQTGLQGIPLYRELRQRAQSLGNRRDFGNGLCRL